MYVEDGLPYAWVNAFFNTTLPPLFLIASNNDNQYREKDICYVRKTQPLSMCMRRWVGYRRVCARKDGGRVATEEYVHEEMGGL